MQELKKKCCEIPSHLLLKSTPDIGEELFEVSL